MAELTHVERLHQVVVDPGLDRLHGQVHVGFASHHDHLDPWIAVLHCPEQVDSRHLRHDDVGNHHLEVFLAEEVQRLHGRMGPLTAQPVGEKLPGHQRGNRGLVVHHQDGGRLVIGLRRHTVAPLSSHRLETGSNRPRLGMIDRGLPYPSVSLGPPAGGLRSTRRAP